MDGSSLPDTRPVVATSLADLQSRFALRDPLSPEDASRLADRLPRLRRRYNEQVQRAKIQFVDPRLKLSSCHSLLLLARETVSASQLVYQSIHSLDDSLQQPARPAVAPEIIEEAIEWNDRQIDRIAAQLQILDATDSQSAWLRGLFGQLESDSRVPSSGWRTLAHQVLAAAGAGLDSEFRLPLPSLPLRAYLTEIGLGRDAEVVGRGIETAGIAAYLLTRRAHDGFDLELLTLAALCQDCGLLLGVGRAGPDGASSTPAAQFRERHPSIGAGLIAGLVEFSTELPALVAQHHRRLNDQRITSDFRGGTQSRSSRWLAILVRWLELIDECRSGIPEAIPTAGRLALAEPARRLVRETLRGDWDRQIAGDLMAELEFRAESETLRKAIPVASSFDSRDGIRRRLDSIDERWPTANLELAQSSRERHHVRAPEK